MNEYNGFEYLLIEVANHFGLDKLLFPQRIEWAKENLDKLEQLEDQVDIDDRPLFVKSVQAIRDAQNHIPTGHMMGLDATASGLQVMSAITGCIVAAKWVNLVDPDVRYDAYTEGTICMNRSLPVDAQISLDSSGHLTRADVKDGIMTSFYGSEAQPEEHFGTGTKELNAFWDMTYVMFPGPSEAKDILLSQWQPYTLQHIWTLPDLHTAHVRVMQVIDARIEVDELDNTTFTHRIEVNQGTKRGKSLVANATHSIDGYIVREMHRRCNYDVVKLTDALGLLDNYLGPDIGYIPKNLSKPVSIAAIGYLSKTTLRKFDRNYLVRLRTMIKEVLKYRSFPLVTVHDEFKASPNNMNRVRYWYKELLAELADSDILQDILREITGDPSITITKKSTDLSKYIRLSNYALS